MAIRKLPSTTVALPLILASLGPAALAQGPVIYPERVRQYSYGMEAEFSSAYVWRGMALTDRPVMHTGFWISGGGMTFAAWNNFVLHNGPETRDLHFTDLSLSYRREWKKLTVEPALEGYVNRPPGGVQVPNTMESSMNLSYPVGPLRAFTFHAFDVLAYRGAYFGEAGVSYERPIRKRTALALSGRSGWASSKFNQAYIGVDKPAFNFVGAEISLLWYLNPHFFFQPRFEFSNILDQQLRENLSRPSIFLFGLAMGFDF